jgi:hypothetical protein
LSEVTRDIKFKAWFLELSQLATRHLSTSSQVTCHNS